SEPRPAGCDVAIARSGFRRTDPEGIQPAVFEMEAKADAFTGKARKVGGPGPGYGLERLVRPDRNGVPAREWFDRLAFAVADVSGELAFAGIGVYKQVFALETDGPSGQRAFVVARIHRGETVAAQQGQAGATDARCR